MKNSLRPLLSIAALLLAAGCSSGGASPAGGNGTTSSASANLGGCKRPVVVKGDVNLHLELTNFFYKPAAFASAFGEPKTAMEAAERCAEEGAGSVYVAAP